MDTEIKLAKVDSMLTRANQYYLEAEVVLTAMSNISSNPEKYKDNIVLALEDACREWDV